MFPFSWNRMDRRTFVRISALMATVSAFSAPVVPPPRVWAGKNKTDYDAIVIGAGLGGLCFAGMMAKNGFKVLALEQHNVPGGYATCFTRDKGRFTFDVSLHQIALAGVTSRIFADLGVPERVKFVTGKRLFRLLANGHEFTCPAGQPQVFEEQLISRYPDQAKGIRSFFAEMMGLNSEVQRFMEGGRLTLLRKVTFPVTYPLMWAARKKSLADYLNEHISNLELQAALSMFCGYYGLPPSKLSGFYYMNATGGYLKNGGSYPIGGSQAISDAIADFIRSKGSEVVLDTRVEEVLLEDNVAAGVKTADGKVFTSKAVVANCSAPTLFGKMVSPESVPVDYRKELASFKPSVSSFQVWLGLNRDITDKVKDSHIFVQSTQDAEKAYKYGLEARADKANYGVCVYNNLYRDYSPPGSTVLVITLISGWAPWEQFEKDYWAGRKDAYRRKKDEITETLIGRVEMDLIPGLRDMIAVKDAATPLTNKRYTLNTEGAIYGYEQSMNNSFMNRLSNRTPVKGLYLSSAWGEPGGGYTGVLISGKRAFGHVMEDWA